MHHKRPQTTDWLSAFFPLQELLCTEGDNLAYTFRHKERREDEEAISFSQYPRPSDTPQVTMTLDIFILLVFAMSMNTFLCYSTTSGH